MDCGKPADTETVELFNDSSEDGLGELGLVQVGISCEDCSSADGDWTTTWIDPDGLPDPRFDPGLYRDQRSS